MIRKYEVSFKLPSEFEDEEANRQMLTVECSSSAQAKGLHIFLKQAGALTVTTYRRDSTLECVSL